MSLWIQNCWYICVINYTTIFVHSNVLTWRHIFVFIFPYLYAQNSSYFPILLITHLLMMYNHWRLVLHTSLHYGCSVYTWGCQSGLGISILLRGSEAPKESASLGSVMNPCMCATSCSGDQGINSCERQYQWNLTQGRFFKCPMHFNDLEALSAIRLKYLCLIDLEV